MEKEESVTTLPDDSANVNFEAFKTTDGIYDISSLNTSTSSRIRRQMNSVLTSGARVKINYPRIPENTFRVVTRNSTSTIPDKESIIVPFEPLEGSGQDVTLELSDSSSVTITYDETSDNINVGGDIYNEGDKFVLDGKAVTVFNI